MDEIMLESVIKNDVHIFLDFLKVSWPIIIGIAAFTISIIINLRKIPEIEKRIVKIEEKYVRYPDIYNTDGTPKFQSGFACGLIREDCMHQQKIFQDNQEKFQNLYCKKLDGLADEIKSIVKDADAKRDRTRDEIHNMQTQVVGLITQVKSLLNQRSQIEIQGMAKEIVQQVMRDLKKNGNT